MLVEIPETRQIPGEGFRRWFSDEKMDLIVWYRREGGALIGFQLCYDKNDREEGEKALTWTEEEGYRLDKVDTGEDRGYTYKEAPVLVKDGVFDSGRIIRDFKEASASLELPLKAFVLEILSKYS
ncbi:hypothetical protein B4O97_02095 [Marispirochaeta aestuarii]|uniref:Uncharacterized protein n=1 Tax=Marispirochaeta aestuarii TaxID=1963862 RepID=A0A1Y1S205_9SPIO|nr:hypothetical protein [Marispirochaeta aestuarii]ORC37816.1 hypothetical protein B4O97_02095 [Marispirochaeta aestuarii]